MTHPDFRRQGPARAGVQRAMQCLGEAIKPDLSLLIATEMGAPLSRELGWQEIPGPLFCGQPGGPLNFSEAFPTLPVMVLLPPGRPPPTGSVDLLGLPW